MFVLQALLWSGMKLVHAAFAVSGTYNEVVRLYSATIWQAPLQIWHTYNTLRLHPMYAVGTASSKDENVFVESVYQKFHWNIVSTR